MESQRIIKTFQHINTYWTEEMYEKCEEEWNQVKEFISDKCGPSKELVCDGCKTVWSDKKFIFKEENICCACDTFSQPYLCNPINHTYVLKYIDEKWHKYLLPEDLLYCKRCYSLDVPEDNSCDFCCDSMCEKCLDLQDTISFHKCDDCKTKWCYFDGKFADYRCQKIGIHSGSCLECGL